MAGIDGGRCAPSGSSAPARRRTCNGTCPRAGSRSLSDPWPSPAGWSADRPGRAIALLTTAQTLRHNTYNVSSGRPFINRERADAVQAITPGLRLGLRPGRQAGPGDNPYLDTTRLTNETGFAPSFDIAAAVADYVAWRAGDPPLKEESAPPGRYAGGGGTMGL